MNSQHFIYSGGEQRIMAGKKIPGTGRGKVHLDYGMMFSGQGENSATLAIKHVVDTNKYTSNGHVFYQYIQLVTVFVAAHYFLKKWTKKCSQSIFCSML